MTAKMAWRSAGTDVWVGNFQGCQHYSLQRREVARKVSWLVLRAGTEIGTFDRKTDASVFALHDEWEVRHAADMLRESGQRAKSLAARNERQGAPFLVIAREPGAHRELELRVRPCPNAFIQEAWDWDVYHPEYNWRYGEIGVHVKYGTAPTEQLAKMAAEEAAQEFGAEARKQRAEIDARVAEMMARP